MATINKALDKPAAPGQGAIATERLSYNTFAERVAQSLAASVSAGPAGNATDKTLCSKDMTWLAALSSLFREACAINSAEKAADRWRLYIADALREHRVSWVLGYARGTVTATVACELLPDREELLRDSFGPLKRRGWGLPPDDERAAKRRRAPAYISFGCKFPLREGLPPILSRGYDILVYNAEHGKKENTGLINHYKKGLTLLRQYQAEPEVELLCMLAIALGMTEDMVLYESNNRSAGFVIDQKPVRHKKREARAFLFALRMLWYLKPSEFTAKKAREASALKHEEETMLSMQSVREATGKSTAPIAHLHSPCTPG